MMLNKVSRLIMILRRLGAGLELILLRAPPPFGPLELSPNGVTDAILSHCDAIVAASDKGNFNRCCSDCCFC